MAMTKEEQRAAARRILEKEPLTEEEQRTYELLKKSPEDYRVPGSVRTCGVCGEKFEDVVDAKGNVTNPSLAQFSDHQAFHNPSPAQWAEAHKRIEAGKERAKKTE
jgi:hypothetical protein